MEAKVVTIKELTEDNPTFCLSPLRVFNKCHGCPVYKRHTQILRGTRQRASKEHQLRCKPHLDARYAELLAQKANLLDMLNHIEKQIKNL